MAAIMPYRLKLVLYISVWSGAGLAISLYVLRDPTFHRLRDSSVDGSGDAARSAGVGLRGIFRRFVAPLPPRIPARAAGAMWELPLREPQKNAPVRAVNRGCVGCSYRLAWIVVKGSKPGLLKTFFVRSRSS